MAFNGVDEKDIGEVKILASLLTNHAPRMVEEEHTHKGTTECWDCAWSPDNKLFAWSCGKRIVKIVPIDYLTRASFSNDELITIDCRQIVSSVSFAAAATNRKRSQHCICPYHKFGDTVILACGLRNGRIRTYDVRTGQVLLELVDHTDVVRHIAFAPDGSMLMASVSQDCTVKIWDLQDDGNMMKTFKTAQCGMKHVVKCVAWSPDALRIATVGTSKSVVIWDMDKLKFAKRLQGHYHDVGSCDFSPDGMLLCTASYDTSAIVWNSFTGQILCRLGHLFPPPSPVFAGGANDTYVRCARFCSNGLVVSTVAEDGFVRFWDLRDTAVPVGLTKVTEPICSTYKPDGKLVAVGTGNGSVHMLDTPKIIPSLKHLCRIHVSRMISDKSNLTKLPIPLILIDYLNYVIVED